MSSPFDEGRDSNAGNFDFGTASDISDADLGGFMDGFRCPTDQLSEQDYRSDAFGGSSERSPMPHEVAAQDPQRFTYPVPQTGGQLAD